MSINKKLIVISTTLVLSFFAVNSAVAESELAPSTQHISAHQLVSDTGSLAHFLADNGAKEMTEDAMKKVRGESIPWLFSVPSRCYLSFCFPEHPYLITPSISK
jgi:hypothetical protein